MSTRTRCGTRAGYKVHKRRMEEQCVDCLAANAAYSREQYATKRSVRDASMAQATQWMKDNPQQHNANVRRAVHKRKSAVGTYSQRDWQRLLNRWDHRCAWGTLFGTCAGERRDDLTVGHVMPLKRKGTNFIGNILPLCQSCNSAQHASTVMEYRSREAKKKSEKYAK